MQFNLSAPSDAACRPAFKVWATVDHAASFGAIATTNIWFGIGASSGVSCIQLPLEPARADKLWRSTCFEAFLKSDGMEAYREWNFAPSGNWAAYDFSGYREGMGQADVAAPPYIRLEDNLTWWTLGATVSVECRAALAARPVGRARGKGRDQILLGACARG